MKMALQILCFVGCLAYVPFAEAQYFQYSQYNFTEQRINPALVGSTRYATASIDFRNQKTGGDFSIQSNFLELSYPVLNSSTGQPISGIGISIHDDRSGGIFQSTEAALSYAIHLHVGRFQTLSMGAKGLYASRNINYDGLYTGSQYVPDRGFDMTASNGENLYGYRNSYFTFSTGLVWRQRDMKGRLLNHLGLSFFDINRPPDSFLNTPSTLPFTFIMDGAFQAFSYNGMHLFPEALITYSAATTVVNAGVRFQKELNSTTKGPSERLEVIAKYATGRSGILGIQMHRENFSFGLSYDFPMQNSDAGNLGALEIGLTVRSMVKTHYQKLVARRQKQVEEKKKAMAIKKQQTDAKSKTTSVKTLSPDTVDTILPVMIDSVKANSTSIQYQITAGELKQDKMVVERITLHFSFEFNSSDLDGPTEDYLKQLIVTLKENENLQVKVKGYTDNIGSDHFNLRLSQKRADVVKQYLLKQGIANDRILSEGRGKGDPLNGNLTDAERALNRRVEIIVY